MRVKRKMYKLNGTREMRSRLYIVSERRGVMICDDGSAGKKADVRRCLAQRLELDLLPLAR